MIPSSFPFRCILGLNWLSQNRGPLHVGYLRVFLELLVEARERHRQCRSVESMQRGRQSSTQPASHRHRLRALVPITYKSKRNGGLFAEIPPMAGVRDRRSE